MVSVATLQSNPSADFRKKYNEWQGLRKQTIGNQSLPLAEQEDLKEAEEKSKDLLSKLMPGYAHYDLEITPLSKVRNRLNVDEAILDFVAVRLYSDAQRAFQDRPSYVAIVHRGKASQSKLVKLNLNQNALSTSQARNQAAYYQQLWQPIEKELTGITTIYISADRALHQISFESLPTADGGFVFDKFNTHRILSVGDIFGLKDASPAKEALLFGNPDFSMPEDTSEIGQGKNGFVIPPGLMGSSENHKEISFSTITATTNEIKSIQSLLKKKKWKAQVQLGQDATTTTFLEDVPGTKGIVHLATKVYYLPPDSVSEPMLLSGIGLAGAKNGWSSNPSYGHITALELSTMDLSKIDLMVLGYHEVNSGEALQAIQASLKFAGVKNTLITLWDVPAEARQMFLGLFYKNLTKNQSIKTALKKTKKKLRKKEDPIVWAGFVLLE